MIEPVKVVNFRVLYSKSATAGVNGARFNRATSASGATSEKSASTGVDGTNPAISTTAMMASSNVASRSGDGDDLGSLTIKIPYFIIYWYDSDQSKNNIDLPEEK